MFLKYSSWEAVTSIYEHNKMINYILQGDVIERIPTIKFEELRPRNQWFLIERTKSIKNQYGWTALMTLKSKDGDVFDVWGTSLITSSIDEKWKKKRNGKLYIKYMGEKKSKIEGKTYFDFRYKTV